MVNLWAENGNLIAYLEREGTAITAVRQFEIVSLPLQCILYDTLTAVLAQRCRGWPAISYVAVSILNN
jgi:hypothetical protein